MTINVYCMPSKLYHCTRFQNPSVGPDPILKSSISMYTFYIKVAENHIHHCNRGECKMKCFNPPICNFQHKIVNITFLLTILTINVFTLLCSSHYPCIHKYGRKCIKQEPQDTCKMFVLQTGSHLMQILNC
jgi:hypothetical protein